jgi:predicted phosphodiesterase
MYRIAIFSDIHGNKEALESIISNIEINEFDEVVCLGDVIGLGPNPKECLDLIMENNIKLVLGNHERYYLNGTYSEQNLSNIEKEHCNWVASELGPSYREYLGKLDICLTITLNDKKVGFMHYPFNQVEDNFYAPKKLTHDYVKRVFRNYSDDFTFMGHSHQDDFYKADNGRVYININSAGCTKGNITSYTIFEFDGENYSVYKKKCIYERTKFDEKLDSIFYPGKEEIRKKFF